MKKGSIICQTVFSSLVFLALIMGIVAQVTYDPYVGVSAMSLILLIIGGLLGLVCVIGTFITGIVNCVKTKHLSSNKGLWLSTAIIAIIAGSISLLLIIVGMAIYIPLLAIAADVMIMVVFAMSIATIIKYKKSGDIE